MATETPSQDGFGQVSRLKGVIFEYGSLAASLLGVASLGVLFSYVGYDAFGLGAAEPAWYAVVVLAVFVPSAGFYAFARTRPLVTKTMRGVLTMLFGGTLTVVASVILFSGIIGPDVWFAHSVFILGPALALLGYARHDERASWAGTVAGAWLVVATVVTVIDDILLALGRQLTGPFDLLTTPEDLLVRAAELFGTPGIYYVTLLVPVAAVAGRYLAARKGNRAGRLFAATVLLVAIVAIPVVDTIPALSRGTWLLGLAGLGTPVLLFVTLHVDDEPGRLGLAFPVVVAVGVLLARAFVDVLAIVGPAPWLDWQFLTSPPSSTATDAGLYPGIIGSVFIIVFVALLTLVFGVGAAIYLEEYARSTGVVGQLTRFIQVNISNLAGVPSIVYGLLGLALFVKLLGMGFGTVIVAAMTLSLLILPIVIISSQEAIRAVPQDMRQASYGMGATRWQTIKTVVLPAAVPGILTGTILALGRAIGETAPLLMIGIANFVTWAPDGVFSRTTAMPMLIYQWAFYPEGAFRHGVVAAAVVALLAVLLAMNSIAVYLRNRYERST